MALDTIPPLPQRKGENQCCSQVEKGEQQSGKSYWYIVERIRVDTSTHWFHSVCHTNSELVARARSIDRDRQTGRQTDRQAGRQTKTESVWTFKHAEVWKCVWAYFWVHINRTKDSGIIISGLPGVLSHGNLLNFRCSQLKAQNTVSIVSSCILTSHQPHRHTASIAFRHPPPNSARFGYATDGALFISTQLSSDAVSALRKVRHW